MLVAQTLTCKACCGLFAFTEEQANFHNQKGHLNLPTRCESCKKKNRHRVPDVRPTIDIVCNCNGLESVVVEKPIKRAQFHDFRKRVRSAFDNAFSRNFQLYRYGEPLSSKAFTDLKNGDEIDIVLLDQIDRDEK